MINKKLLSFDPAAMRYVWRCVLCQWLSLLCNVAFVWALAGIVGAGWDCGRRAGGRAGCWRMARGVCCLHDQHSTAHRLHHAGFRDER